MQLSLLQIPLELKECNMAVLDNPLSCRHIDRDSFEFKSKDPHKLECFLVYRKFVYRY